MAWWIWIVGGVALCLMEMLTPGVFYLLFFGVGALMVGILSWIGLIETDWVQVLLFSVFSIVALVLFRRMLLDQLMKDEPDEHPTALKNQTGLALDDIPAGGKGKVEMRGTGWSAHNNGDTPIEKGQKCTVEYVEGVIIYVRGE